MSIVACTHPRPPVDRRPRWRASSAGGSSSARSPVLESLDWRHYARDAQMVVLSGDPRIPIGDLPSGHHPPRATSASARPMRAGRTGRRCAVSRSSSSRIPTGPTTSGSTCATSAGRRSCCARRSPRLMTLGFDGLMLDTIDTAPYLENEGPGAVRGLAPGAARLAARACASAFPRAVVVANGSDGAGRRRAVRRRLRRRGGVRDLRLRPATSTAPRPTPNATWKLARDRARARRRAAPRVHDRVRRRRRRRPVALGRRANRSATGFAPTSGVRDLNTAP